MAALHRAGIIAVAHALPELVIQIAVTEQQVQPFVVNGAIGIAKGQIGKVGIRRDPAIAIGVGYLGIKDQPLAFVDLVAARAREQPCVTVAVR